MKNHSLKTSAAFYEVKSSLDSNRKNISTKFQMPLTGSIAMKKTFVFPVIAAFLAALLAFSSLASAFGSIYWRGSNGTLWTAGDNWSSDSGGTVPENFFTNAPINFSATGSSNSSSTDLGGDQTISSLTINSTDPVGISGGNLTVSGDISVGSSSSNNSLQISNGGVVSPSSMSVGAEVGANNNQVTVGANATLTLGDDIYVGGNGSSNSLSITNGGAVSANYTSAGREAGSNNNTILVTSNASVLINNDLIVGEGGSSNSMTVSEGGHVTSSVGYIGKNATSTDNTVTVTGTNSTWTNNGTLHVGYEGTGSLTINGTSHVTSVGGYLGYSPGSNGTVGVSGGSWTNNDDLSVGFEGTGSLAINGTGNVTNVHGAVGNQAGSNGTVSVSGGLIGNRFWPFGALARSLKLEDLISMSGCCQMGL